MSSASAPNIRTIYAHKTPAVRDTSYAIGETAMLIIIGLHHELHENRVHCRRMSLVDHAAFIAGATITTEQLILRGNPHAIISDKDFIGSHVRLNLRGTSDILADIAATLPCHSLDDLGAAYFQLELRIAAMLWVHHEELAA